MNQKPWSLKRNTGTFKAYVYEPVPLTDRVWLECCRNGIMKPSDKKSPLHALPVSLNL